jgi:hypothetical protein
MKKVFFLSIICLFKLFCEGISAKSEDKLCVVFVSDEGYLPKFYQTYEMLRTNGNYSEDVVLIITDQWLEKKILASSLFKKKNMRRNFSIKYFPKISVTEQLIKNCLTESKCLGYIQKYHVFDTFFCSWNYVFYIDCGMQIYSDIKKIVNLRRENIMLAHSDCYCSPWTGIYAAFKEEGSEAYQELKDKYDLSKDYFQSTVMLFDTKLIEKSTKEDIINLTYKYPIGSSDQAYIALYFTQINPKWQQIALGDQKTWFYDFSNRHPGPYIMVKYPEVCAKSLPNINPNLDLILNTN